MSTDGRPPANDATGDQPSNFTRLADEFKEVLAGYTKRYPDETAPKEEEAGAIQSLREKLFQLVFDYDSAVEMAKCWLTADPGDQPGLELQDWAKLSLEERSKLEKVNPWQAFVESEDERGALWVHLHSEAWDLWHRVPRSDTVRDLGDSVFGVLIAQLEDEERRRFPNKEPRPGLGERFHKARKTAWKVVVEEILKPMSGLKKLSFHQTDLAELQKHFDAASPLRAFPFGRVPQSIRRLLPDPEWKIRDKAIEPTKEIVAALLWTSNHLPLCLMKSKAAADAVREILLSGIRLDTDEITAKKDFRQNFRVMTGERSLEYFEKSLLIHSQRAEIIAEFRVEPVKEPMSGEELERDVEPPRCDGGAAPIPDDPGQGLHDLLAEVVRIEEALNWVLALLSEVCAAKKRVRTDTAAKEPRHPLDSDLEERIRSLDGIRLELLNESMRLLQLRQKARKLIPAPAPAGVPRLPSRFATLVIDDAYHRAPSASRSRAIEQLRFRFLDFDHGLIAPENEA